MRALAEIDPYLCEKVAEGLGLPVPKATRELPSVRPSAAISQIGRKWPTKGRIIGIIADDGADLDAVRALREQIFDGDMVPLVIAPAGGRLGADGDDPIVVQRSFATGRSIEFDALILAGVPAQGKDAFATRDAKAWNGSTPAPVDPRALLMLTEAYRHAKPLGALSGARQAFDTAGIPVDAPGIVVGDDAGDVLGQITDLLGHHRVWERFPAHA